MSWGGAGCVFRWLCLGGVVPVVPSSLAEVGVQLMGCVGNWLTRGGVSLCLSDGVLSADCVVSLLCCGTAPRVGDYCASYHLLSDTTDEQRRLTRRLHDEGHLNQ